ncbi:MAG TPA: DUF1573 domain-containing protein [Thermoanaerobaculia bacterium]|jgi:hypothetical protein|nr:DUF1573 domain-containing protein [Thermoanaerobaculia bacterium]
MNRHLKTVNLALCCVLLAAATLIAQGAAGKPKAVAVEPIKDVGFVAKGDMATHEFVISNDGNAPLELREVRAACGCTVADFDKVIAPGKTGKVRVTVDTKSFNGPTAKGVTVYTNDPDAPTIELTVRADVGQFIKMKPGYARFITVQGEEKEGKIVQTLWTPDKTPLEIVKVESPYPFLKVRYWEAKPEERLAENADQQQWKVEIHLSNDAPIGALSEPVKIHTNHPKQKLVQVPISGFVRPMVAVTPPIVDMGQVSGTNPVRFSLNVRNFATEPIKLTSIAGDVQGINAKIEPVQEGREYTVQVTFQPEARKGPVNGKLTLTTDSKKVPWIEVQLKGNVI